MWASGVEKCRWGGGASPRLSLAGPPRRRDRASVALHRRARESATPPPRLPPRSARPPARGGRSKLRKGAVGATLEDAGERAPPPSSPARPHRRRGGRETAGASLPSRARAPALGGGIHGSVGMSFGEGLHQVCAEAESERGVTRPHECLGGGGLAVPGVIRSATHGVAGRRRHGQSRGITATSWTREGLRRCPIARSRTQEHARKRSSHPPGSARRVRLRQVLNAMNQDCRSVLAPKDRRRRPLGMAMGLPWHRGASGRACEAPSADRLELVCGARRGRPSLRGAGERLRVRPVRLAASSGRRPAADMRMREVAERSRDISANALPSVLAPTRMQKELPRRLAPRVSPRGSELVSATRVERHLERVREAEARYAGLPMFRGELDRWKRGGARVE